MQKKKDQIKFFFEQALKTLLPNDNEKTLVNYTILEKGYSAALFRPHKEEIVMSIDKMKKWLDDNANDLKEVYNIDNVNQFKIFLSLFAIDHEIEHANQFLISKDLITAPNTLIANGYKGILELFNKDNSIIPRPIKNTRKDLSLMLYRIKQYNYILERNANVESANLLTQLALYLDNENIFNIFNNLKTQFLKIGYTKSNMGCLEETYRSILMYDKYKKFDKNLVLCEEDKVRYGFNISNETKVKVLNNK